MEDGRRDFRFSQICPGSEARKGLILFHTVHYKIISEKLPSQFDGFRIAHLSDLHGAVFGRRNEKLLQEIQKIKPDMIVMTGDMADNSGQALVRLLDLCRQLCRQNQAFCIRKARDSGMAERHVPAAARKGIYYVVGNHEQCLKGSGQARLIRHLESMGVKVLENNWCTISHKGAYLKMYGLVTPMIYYKDRLREYRRGICFTKRDVETALGKADSSCFNILLSHNPLYYPAYRDWGADLTFSGHIHGGIIRIPGLGGLLSPDMTFFPKYDGGHFQEKGRHLVVSRGLGNHFLMRVMNPPELVEVTLSVKDRCSSF